MHAELQPELIHLNHAAVGPWPSRTREAVCRFAEENARLGSQRYPRWLAVERRLRERLRQMINAPASDDIALLKSTSEGLSLVAYGLDWRAGDSVVTAAEEFPSNRIVWESLRDRGVETRCVDLRAAADPEQALIAAMDGSTRLLAISAIQYASGLRLDLTRLGAACRARGALFCVDAIQAIGALRFDVQAYDIDFVVADGHKWMLGPEGVALFYCRASLRERLRLNQYGWHMVEAMGEFERKTWQPAASARRFECGSPNMVGIHALDASLSLLLEVGLSEVERLLLERVELLIEAIRSRPQLELLTPIRTGRFGGIVTFRHRSRDADTLLHVLQQAHVLCAARGGGIRFSPHFYTTEEQIEAALKVVDRMAPLNPS